MTDWRTDEPPKDGTPIYIRVIQPYRFKPYHQNSVQWKRGEKGRWQVMNEYGGWENSHPLGNEWSLESPFATSPVAALSNGNAAVRNGADFGKPWLTEDDVP